MAASASTNLLALSNMTAPSRAYQLVVIAKPSPGHPYRQLASVIQSCRCTQSILIPCLKALRALSDKSNRAGVLQELKFAADYKAAGVDVTIPADDFYQTTDQKDAECRFSYIAATLVSSIATCCLDQEHAGYDCSLETPFHVVKAGLGTAVDAHYEDCGTDNTITVGVVDITNPHEPRYCFLNMDRKCIKCGLWWYELVNDTIVDELASWETTDYTPLSCDALLQFLDVGSGTTVSTQSEAREMEALDALRVFPVVDIAALASCWPAKAWNSSGQLEAHSNQTSASTNTLAPTSNRGAKSLSELAQESILDAILADILEDLDLLNEPMLFRGFPQSFLSVCAKRVKELAVFKHQEMIAELLARLLQGTEHVDMYPFRMLPIPTILLALRSDRLKRLRTINLSGLFIAYPEQIWTAIDVLPNRPEVVYLLSPPSADKANENEVVLSSFPSNTGRNTFWDRVGSTKIIMSAALSTAVVSHCSTRRSTTMGWKQMSIGYLREIVSGDTYRLQMLPHSSWWERDNFSWPA